MGVPRPLANFSISNPFTFTTQLGVWILLGLGCGLVASTYWLTLAWLTDQGRFLQGAGVVALMGGAGLGVGLLIHWLGDPGEISQLVDDVHLRGGRIEARRNPNMLMTSLLSIASGGSLGPEAPMVQLTGSLGTWLADRLGLGGGELRCLSLAGMAAGFTALFGAPLGGAFFALEILHDQHFLEYYRAVVPALVASCSSYLVFVLITHLGLAPDWHFPQYHLQGIDDILTAMLYGALGAGAAWVFITLVSLVRRAVPKIPGPVYLHTTLAGLVLGVLGVVWPLSRYFGDAQLNTLLSVQLGMWGLLGLAVVKMVAVSVTIAGEWRGGLIIPLFFIGACLGKALTLPGVDPSLAMIATMAALNAAVTRTPISTGILLAKLTGASPLTPILFAGLVGFFLSPRTPFIKSQSDHPSCPL